jgi:hypothetical protein
MNYRWLIVFAAVAIAVLFAVWWLPASQQQKVEPLRSVQASPSPTPSTPVVQNPSPATPVPTNAAPFVNAPDVPQQQRFLAIFNTPISFYGRVVNENGLPVPGAVAKMRAADKPWANGTQHERLSDENGFFEITGINGAELFVEVVKEGYHQTEASRKSVRYAGPPSSTTVSVPTQDAPTLFVLKQKGAPASLIHISERPIKVPKNGSPLEVSLKTGRAVARGQGDLQVEVWTEDGRRDSEGRYPWRCRLSVSGGGLLERTDPQTFEAPAEGYLPTIELASSEQQWSSRSESHYFVALRDGSFARLAFRLRTDGEHYFVIESFLNREPGSRNLEYDRSLRIAAPKQP